MVEFAIAALVFLLLVFAVLNFSMAIYSYNLVSNAAREATRYASVHGSSASSPASLADVEQFVQNEAPGLNPANLTVNTSWNPDNNPGSFVRVQVQYNFDFVMPFVSLSAVSLVSTSQLVIAQ